ncbi:NAD(P)-binding protein [Calocera viscosa TUFC12733]|uniref:NAD(P)-binding protein n=1 Tax=Calocera viscosa (strain TUFC12733) TaxID=1330018 RepID=A0A167KNW6_CALVF|nr:NAD(P)-binding protein [Calocera viscosa TUFC12733]
MTYGSTSTAPTVLVTAASGFVGSATVLELVSRGFLVKAAVPSVSRARAFLKKHPACAPAIEWAIVPSLTEPRAVEEAVRDVDYIIHVCSPFALAYEDPMDLLVPAVEGTHALLAAAARQQRVKHVVLTSSFGAVLDPTASPAARKHYTPSSWNPATWETALSATDAVELHLATKTLAERSAWEFVALNGPSYALTTFCPPVVLGPPAQPLPDLAPAQLGESVAQAWRLLSGSLSSVPETRFPLFVDVRDLARLQVSALGREEARGKRYLAVGGEFSNAQIAALARSQFPQEAYRIPIPSAAASRRAAHYTADMSATERDFGKSWTPLAKSVRDMAEALYRREREVERETGTGAGRAWWAGQEELELPHMEQGMTVEVA